MSKKDFKRGMEAGAKPFEEKFKQVSEAVERVGEGLNQKLDNIKGTMNTVIDDLSSIQKKELYDLSTQYDIKELERPDKELLIAGLYTLSAMSDNLTEYQKAFIRSVQKYIGVKNPQTSVDLSIAIENVENVTTQRAILQAFMEFLYLENENVSFLDDYEELFEFFNVNKKGRESIIDSIQKVYHATGAQGISEKYGYVPERIVESGSVDEGGKSIAVLGHIDHGKSTLTAAITKTLYERYGLGKPVSYDEIDSGLSIEYETKKRHYTHVDLPGHSDYVKGIITGDVQMDGAILVVSAIDGPMPQTKIHALLARYLGLENIVVFMNKCDEVDDDELLDLVEKEICDLLSKFGFSYKVSPVIRGSATEALKNPAGKWGDAIVDLMSSVDKYIVTPVHKAEKAQPKQCSKFLAEIYHYSTADGGGEMRSYSAMFDGLNFGLLIKTITDDVTAEGKITLRRDPSRLEPGYNCVAEFKLSSPALIGRWDSFDIYDEATDVLKSSSSRAIGCGIVTSILE